MIRMKALTSFGYGGVNEGPVKRGREFAVASERRAYDLEEHGLAFRLESKMQAASENKMEPLPENKAAQAGPLGSVGGATGADEPQPSSPPDHPPPRQRRSSARLKKKASRS